MVLSTIEALLGETGKHLLLGMLTQPEEVRAVHPLCAHVLILIMLSYALHGYLISLSLYAYVS